MRLLGVGGMGEVYLNWTSAAVCSSSFALLLFGEGGKAGQFDA